MPTLTYPLRPKTEGLWFVRVERLQECNICRLHPARYDALVPEAHTWAYLCEECALTYRIVLGLGRGQVLLLSGEALPD